MQQLVTKSLSVDENKTGEQQLSRTAHTFFVVWLHPQSLAIDCSTYVVACDKRTFSNPTAMAFIIFVLIYIVVL